MRRRLTCSPGSWGSWRTVQTYVGTIVRSIIRFRLRVRAPPHWSARPLGAGASRGVLPPLGVGKNTTKHRSTITASQLPVGALLHRIQNAPARAWGRLARGRFSHRSAPLGDVAEPVYLTSCPRWDAGLRWRVGRGLGEPALGGGQLRPTANRPALGDECGAFVRLAAGAFHGVVRGVHRTGCRAGVGVLSDVDRHLG